jgi:hypothetical protein
MSSPQHILNCLLPSIESQQIEANDQASRQAIQSSIHRIRNCLRGQDAAAADVTADGVDAVDDDDAASTLQRAHVSNADLGRLFRLVNTHNTLKYDLPADLIDEVLSLLYDVSLTAKELLSVPMKIKALKLMKTLCEKGKHLIGLRFQFSWRTVWQEITLILSRGTVRIYLLSVDCRLSIFD